RAALDRACDRHAPAHQGPECDDQRGRQHAFLAGAHAVALRGQPLSRLLFGDAVADLQIGGPVRARLPRSRRNRGRERYRADRRGAVTEDLAKDHHSGEPRRWVGHRRAELICKLPTEATFMPTPSHAPVALAQALIRCRSITPTEAGALTWLAGELEPLGFVCHRLTMREPDTPDVDNFYARLGTGAPHLAFAGHTDVVP